MKIFTIITIGGLLLILLMQPKRLTWGHGLGAMGLAIYQIKTILPSDSYHDMLKGMSLFMCNY